MSVTTETDQAPAVVESSTDQQQQPTSNDGTSNIMVKLITGISFPNSRRRKSSDISDDTSTASSSATHPEKRSKYCPFPKSTTDYLHDWLINHTDYPFPNADEKEAMANGARQRHCWYVGRYVESHGEPRRIGEQVRVPAARQRCAAGP